MIPRIMESQMENAQATGFVGGGDAGLGLLSFFFFFSGFFCCTGSLSLKLTLNIEP